MNIFTSHIEGSKPVLVDFFAEWCGPCKMMPPVLSQVKEKIGNRATIVKMNIDKNPTFASKYNVQAVPTLILFENGNIVWLKSGVVPVHEIYENLNFHITYTYYFTNRYNSIN